MIAEDVKLKDLDNHINYILKKDFYKNRTLECCPICFCKAHIKYGFYNGIQRYKCKKCNKTFSQTTNSLWSYSKKDTKLWIEFIELMFEKKSLRFCAEKLHISLVTAFYWRHKVLHGIDLDSTPKDLNGIVYMAKMIVPESLKGCRNVDITTKKDWSRNIWIIGAKGAEDSIFAKPIFRGCWDLSIFHKKIYCKIAKNSYIVTYGDRYLESIAKKHNKNKRLDVKDDNRIRYFILNFKTWLEVYHGIATKYLQRYLSFFILFNLDKTFNYMDLMYNSLMSGNRFVKTNNLRIIKNCLY